MKMPNSQKNQREISKDGKNIEISTVQEKTQVSFQENSSNRPLTYSEHLQIKISFGDENLNKRFNQRFMNNKITTTKYNIITWVPKSLLLQFRRIANIYFLIISIFTCFYFSPKNPFTMIGTFALVLIFTMCKEGYEDIKRYRQDKEVNLKEITFFNKFSNKYEKKLWQDIRVGDLIIVKNEEYIPADILFLKSSLDNGLCFVESMNLDGETNLKEKMVPPGLNNFSIEKLIISSGFIICEKPNDNLESWESSILFDNVKESLYCGLKQLLIRGCKLKNTESVIGIAIYTGHNTKIMKNSKSPPVKVSNLMKTMNKLLYSVFIFQILLCIFFTAGNKIWNEIIINEDIKNNKNSAWYISVSQDLFFIKFLTFLLAYSHLIPISLYVALELVKLIQSVLIYYDSKIYDKILNKPSTARTSDLIEELGQVEIIFSDKTGTLTKNEMEFRKCSISKNIYGDINCSMNSYQMHSKTLNTINGDPKAYNILISPPAENIEDKRKINEFFTICSVCHSAYISEKKFNKTFQSSSPDEVALIQGAAQMGFLFNKRTSDGIETINPIGEVQFWNLLMELPFDSIRKRMSVIVTLSNQGNGIQTSTNKNYYLFTKGADSAMLPKMSLGEDDRSFINNCLEKFANEGLRTLVLGQKFLSENEFLEIKSKFHKISISNDQDKEKNINKLYDDVESGLEYVGSSAIEDKLQDEVPETIETLIKANIRIWILTGDKKETAIEIGKSCRLIKEYEMEKIDLASSSDIDYSKEEFEKAIEGIYRKYVEKKNSISYNYNEFDDIISKSNINFNKNLYLVIDGKNLAFVLSDVNLSKKFFRLAMMAISVICCRVSPKQKSQVIKLTKQNTKFITLSIGDGANDVPMIMEAHIGIGISGKEGTQAVRSADYSIGQFQFLKRLVLVHGRWGYRRISYFVCYYFYKNILLVLTEIYFAFFNGFSGQIFFPDLLPLCYNAFWTSWPCIFAYSIERDVDDEMSVKYPILYKAGQEKFYFSLRKFWTWIVFAIIHGVIIFFTVTEATKQILNNNGLIPNHWFISTLCFSCIVQIATLKIFVDLMYWNFLSVSFAILSILLYYLTLIIFCIPRISTIMQNELSMKIFEIYTNYKSCVVLFLIPFFTLLPDFTFRFLQKIVNPTPADIISSNLLYKENTTFISMSSIKPKKLNLEDSNEIILAKNTSIQNKQEEFKKFDNFATNSPLVFNSKNENSNTRMNIADNFIKRGSRISRIDKNNIHENLQKDFLIEYIMKDSENYNNLGQVVYNPQVHESKDFLKDET